MVRMSRAAKNMVAAARRRAGDAWQWIFGREIQKALIAYEAMAVVMA